MKQRARIARAATADHVPDGSDDRGKGLPITIRIAPDGRIYPNLPADSVWKAFGPPITLPDLDVHDPRVASWPWTVPAGFDPSSFCVGLFVHSFDSPLVETSVNLNEITPRQRQVGQLFVGQILPTRIRVAHLAGVVWKLLRGVRDGFGIFVDPLWDPVRTRLSGFFTGTGGRRR